MASWVLIPCLVKLRSEFNAVAPSRDRSSDGSVGDLAHQSSQSDHNPDETGNVPIRDADRDNEVHGLDVDVDLRTPGLTMELLVQRILARCRSGAEKRLRYIIFNRRIWSASNGWRQQAYTGANPHDHHAHFSASYETELEASAASWHLTDQEDDDMSADDWKKLDARLAAIDVKLAALTLAPQKTWEHKLPNGKTAHGTLIEANLRSASAANDQLPRMSTVLTQLAAGRVDQAALVAALTAAIVPAFLAAVEPKLGDHDVVTADELKAAIVAATRDLLNLARPA